MITCLQTMHHLAGEDHFPVIADARCADSGWPGRRRSPAISCGVRDARHRWGTDNPERPVSPDENGFLKHDDTRVHALETGFLINNCFPQLPPAPRNPGAACE
ncbi:MAG TPA: hypothetical protein PLM96_03405 [Methanoregulaceae archaeon]|nr:hypothetical protein [Methanolinea sp.]MDD5685405.1 hypothetical protein [Methanoregulaceae archaeon]HOP66651.1 hypothetical protein [Methanoregulaceae archaeon]HPJ74066.1 hypothetical protein [Methanoregulaceae archaeon]HPQ75678.1 hypothetical protein [Methanoregulaceae archaeon]